jgi:hypothetical protein
MSEEQKYQIYVKWKTNSWDVDPLRRYCVSPEEVRAGCFCLDRDTVIEEITLILIEISDTNRRMYVRHSIEITHVAPILLRFPIEDIIDLKNKVFDFVTMFEM